MPKTKNNTKAVPVRRSDRKKPKTKETPTANYRTRSNNSPGLTKYDPIWDRDLLPSFAGSLNTSPDHPPHPVLCKKCNLKLHYVDLQNGT